MTHQEAEVSGEKLLIYDEASLLTEHQWVAFTFKVSASTTLRFGPDPEEPNEDEARISAIWRNETDKREGWVKREPAFNPFARVVQLDQTACCVGPRSKA